jgi:NTP pyrophosphatase (non-canonical NTP hydrolase)
LADDPFGIGADVWPGLAKTAEEAGELLQVIGKLVATGGRSAHYDGSDLRTRLIEECGDLLAALGYLTAANGIEAEVAERAARKRELFQAWHDAEARRRALPP